MYGLVRLNLNSPELVGQVGAIWVGLGDRWISYTYTDAVGKGGKFAVSGNDIIVMRFISICELIPWRQGFKDPTKNECTGWFA